MDKNSGVILAWVNGKRTDESLKKLLYYLKDTPIGRYYTDDWGAYSRHISSTIHIIGKDNTWKIERKNLNFRTHLKRLNRKTICFSKNPQIHDNVIGMYIEKYYYKSGTFGNWVCIFFVSILSIETVFKVNFAFFYNNKIQLFKQFSYFIFLENTSKINTLTQF